MALSEKQIADYKQNGYILLKGFFEKSRIAKIFNDVREVFAIQFSRVLNMPLEKSMQMGEEEFSAQMIELYKKDFTVFSNCSKQVQHIISLHELGTANELLEVLKELGIARPIISVRPCVLMNNVGLDKEGKKGRYWRLPPHQDWYYSQGSLDSVTVWYPYVRVTKELGSLEIVPGSHLWGLQECNEGDGYGEMSKDIADDKFVTFDTEPGDVLVFVSLMIHRSGVNSTNKVRWSSQFRFNNLLEPTFIGRRFPNPFAYYPTRVLETPNFPQPDDLTKAFK